MRIGTIVLPFPTILQTEIQLRILMVLQHAMRLLLSRHRLHELTLLKTHSKRFASRTKKLIKLTLMDKQFFTKWFLIHLMSQKYFSILTNTMERLRFLNGIRPSCLLSLKMQISLGTSISQMRYVSICSLMRKRITSDS